MSGFKIVWGPVPAIIGWAAVFICMAIAATKGGKLGLVAAVVVLVDTLERHGIRCQVDVVKSTTNKVDDGPTLENYLTVKEFNEQVDIGTLAYFVGHESTLRRLFWSVQEHEPLAERMKYGIGFDTRGSYGFPGEASDKGELYIGRLISPRDWDEAFTMAWLQATLKRHGIVLESKV